MTYLLDTNTCIRFLNNRSSVVAERVSELGPDLVVVSSLTIAELLFGAARSSRPEANRQRVETFTRELRVVAFDHTCAGHFGRLKADLFSRGRPIPDFDIAIAATALSQGATVVTADGHFGHVDELQVEDWTA